MKKGWFVLELGEYA